MAFCSYRGNQGVRLIPMIICSSVQYNIRMNLGPVIVEEEVKRFIEKVIMPIVIYNESFLSLSTAFIFYDW